MTEVVEKKKRGRKKKDPNAENITIKIETTEPTGPKKRGRKPKGGKIIVKEPEKRPTQYSHTNIILHLKCSLSDINENILDQLSYNPSVPPEIETYNYKEEQFFTLQDDSTKIDYAYNQKKQICTICDGKNTVDEDVNIKDKNNKLKSLKINLYKDTLQDKKAACFWCTYEYDNHPCYIPKYEMDDTLYGYGSFCRPECAVAFLMNENIDDSSKFERYGLLNNIYGKVFNFEKNIKPAPNPYYTLDKFYGNLSIQEYRRLLNSEHLLMVLEKPMTRILPELFEDNDNFVTNIYGNSNENSSGNSNSVYKVKRASEKKEKSSKTNLIKNTFGLAS